MPLLIANVVWFSVIVGLLAYGVISDSDGYGMIALSVLAYAILGNLLYFAGRRRIRQSSGSWLEFGIFALALFLGNSSVYSTEAVLTYCSLDCFGLDIVFFERLLLAIFAVASSAWLIYSTRGRQRIISIAVSIAVLGLFAAGPVLRWYDRASIIEFPESSTYSKDRDEAYCLTPLQNRETIPWADAETFVAIDNLYARDHARVYYLCHPLPHADTASFGLVESGPPYRKQIDIRSPEWFHILSTVDVRYARDKDHVFFRDMVVIGADPSSFESLGDGYGRDGERYYFEGNPRDESEFGKRAE